MKYGQANGLAAIELSLLLPAISEIPQRVSHGHGTVFLKGRESVTEVGVLSCTATRGTRGTRTPFVATNGRDPCIPATEEQGRAEGRGSIASRGRLHIGKRAATSSSVGVRGLTFPGNAACDLGSETPFLPGLARADLAGCKFPGEGAPDPCLFQNRHPGHPTGIQVFMPSMFESGKYSRCFMKG